MQQKIKLFILSALIIQGCFFSTSAYAISYYRGYVQMSNGGAYAFTDWGFTDSTIATEAGCTSAGGQMLVAGRCGLVGNETDGWTWSPYPGAEGKSCAAFITAAGTCVADDPSVKDCSGNTETIVASYFGSLTSVINFDGCSYTTGPKVCGDDGFCTGTATGTGTESTPETVDATTVTASPEEPAAEETTTDNTGTFSSDTVTTDNGDGTTTDTTTDVSTSSNGIKETLSYDGDTVVITNSDGSQTATTTVTTTITHTDGTQTESTTTTSQTSAGGTTTDTVNVNTGQTTTTTNPPVTSTSTTGSTTTYDSSGNITSRTYSDPVNETEEPTDPNCPSCVPSEDGFVNGDYDALQSGIDALGDPFNTSGMVQPTLSYTLGSLGTCSNTNYSAQVLGTTFSPDICTYIQILQSVLYFFFASITAFYLFTVATTLGKKS